MAGRFNLKLRAHFFNKIAHSRRFQGVITTSGMPTISTKIADTTFGPAGSSSVSNQGVG